MEYDELLLYYLAHVGNDSKTLPRRSCDDELNASITRMIFARSVLLAQPSSHPTLYALLGISTGALAKQICRFAVSTTERGAVMCATECCSAMVLPFNDFGGAACACGWPECIARFCEECAASVETTALCAARMQLLCAMRDMKAAPLAQLGNVPSRSDAFKNACAVSIARMPSKQRTSEYWDLVANDAVNRRLAELTAASASELEDEDTAKDITKSTGQPHSTSDLTRLLIETTEASRNAIGCWSSEDGSAAAALRSLSPDATELSVAKVCIKKLMRSAISTKTSAGWKPEALPTDLAPSLAEMASLQFKLLLAQRKTLVTITTRALWQQEQGQDRSGEPELEQENSSAGRVVPIAAAQELEIRRRLCTASLTCLLQVLRRRKSPDSVVRFFAELLRSNRCAWDTLLTMIDPRDDENDAFNDIALLALSVVTAFINAGQALRASPKIGRVYKTFGWKRAFLCDADWLHEKRAILCDAVDASASAIFALRRRAKNESAGFDLAVALLASWFDALALPPSPPSPPRRTATRLVSEFTPISDLIATPPPRKQKQTEVDVMRKGETMSAKSEKAMRISLQAKRKLVEEALERKMKQDVRDMLDIAVTQQLFEMSFDRCIMDIR